MSDHNLDYIDKKKKPIQNQAIALTPTVTVGLIVSDIKTNIQGKSCVISKNGKGQHINFKNIKCWHVDSNSLVIQTVDQSISIVLTFATEAEALQGEMRWANIFNGALLI